MSKTPKLSAEEIARQVVSLVLAYANKGFMLPRTIESVIISLRSGDGYPVIFHNIVTAYAECVQLEHYHKIFSVVSGEGGKGARHGIAAVVNRIKECWRRDRKKNIILACAPDKITYYQKFGFELQPQAEAPTCVRSGRSDEEWMTCDRVWMMCTMSSYLKKKEIGTMAKPNAFVKISGDLLERPAVLEWLHELSKAYSVAICVGGGKQINEAFIENGFPKRYSLLGRITASLAERQLARDVLERNEALVQDLLDDHGISARAIIPVMDIGGVLCHINGDVLVLTAYLGYDKLFILTEKNRVESKKAWLDKLAKVLAISEGSKEETKLDKIEVIGF